MTALFRKVLIANRGEIALRIIRTLREMGIPSVAAFSDADRDALFVREADEAYRLGPAPATESYLNVQAILEVARQAGADGVHPGYGFLAENAPFAEAIGEAGLVFIGPSPHALRVMGDKVLARAAAAARGVPVAPGSPGPVEQVEDALAFALEVGYPIAVKASGGGGGRGIRVVETPEEMAGALDAARREAGAYFKNSEVYLERYFHDPRHVEIQILGDKTGHIVHLGERDCSVQRRHQKLIEESPSPAVDRELRERIGEMAIRAATCVEYDSAGTVEFLLTREREFYFLEMNTRIQVEHPVTEMVAGVDLVREMILAAAGKPITVRENLLEPNGHAIEIRINAENPFQGFRPTPGAITQYLPPGGPGVRVDSGVYAGYTVPGDYDSLIAKLISWAPDRETARRRSLRALDEYAIEGVSTTISFARAVIEHPTFVSGEVGTQFLAEHGEELLVGPADALSVELGYAAEERGPGRTFEVEVNRKLFRVTVSERASRNNSRGKVRSGRPKRAAAPSGTELPSPMNGTVVGVRKTVGDAVHKGDVLFIVEAMKMENEVAAHRTGTLTAVDVEIGDAVESGRRLAVIE